MADDDRPTGATGDVGSNEDPGSEDGPDPELGSALSGEPADQLSLLGHFYRGQLDRETTWRTRLDRTTDWAVLVIATLLTWTFSSPDNPHYILLIGVLLIVVFLLVEAHRYRAYDVPRSRVRMLEEELFARVFDPDRGVEHEDWRHLLGEDLRRPATTVTTRVAIARRLRRVYLPLLSILLAAWVVRVTAFEPGDNWVEAAALSPVPGTIVIAAVVLLYAATVTVAVWPQQTGRREVEAESTDDWQRQEE